MGFEIKLKIEKIRPPKTVILKWNPSISSYKMEQFEEELADMRGGWDILDANWSVWDYKNVQEGDRFYMVKVGPGENGIVMSGILSSEPYQLEDWSGRGRVVYYMDMDIIDMIHPDYCPLLTSDKLTEEIPDFTWTGGHSGVILTDEQAEKLDKLWFKYLSENELMIKNTSVSRRNLEEN